ncbi:MAG: hypothetical protein K8R44_02100 [Sulfurimonas sp.]|nr:hypothetical protein [Sulfurimonas sp.]
MGSSHARNHINPKYIASQSSRYKINEIFNIGAGAASPYAMYITYKKNSIKFKNLDLVYYDLSPHMLSEKYFMYLKYEKIFLNYKQWNYFMKFHSSYLKKYHININLYFFPIIIFIYSCEFSRKIFSGRNNGFDPLNHKKFVSTQPNTLKKYIYEPYEVFPISEFQIKHLAKLKHEIENNGSKFILFLSPTYSWYEFYKKELSQYDDKLIKLLNMHLGNTIVLGSLNSDIYNLEYNSFYDDTHLSEKGANNFTRNIFHDIDKHNNLEAIEIKNLYKYGENNGS